MEGLTSLNTLLVFLQYFQSTINFVFALMEVDPFLWSRTLKEQSSPSSWNWLKTNPCDPILLLGTTSLGPIRPTMKICRNLDFMLINWIIIQLITSSSIEFAGNFWTCMSASLLGPYFQVRMPWYKTHVQWTRNRFFYIANYLNVCFDRLYYSSSACLACLSGSCLHIMADHHVQDEKEVKRRKQLKKMTKILAKAWELPKSEPFQESSRFSSQGNVFDLATLGEYLGEGCYKLGRSGWAKFAQDIGGVYNRHIEWYVINITWLTICYQCNVVVTSLRNGGCQGADFRRLLESSKHSSILEIELIGSCGSSRLPI